jgi:hypothetical protein
MILLTENMTMNFFRVYRDEIEVILEEMSKDYQMDLVLDFHEMSRQLNHDQGLYPWTLNFFSVRGEKRRVYVAEGGLDFCHESSPSHGGWEDLADYAMIEDGSEAVCLDFVKRSNILEIAPKLEWKKGYVKEWSDRILK